MLKKTYIIFILITVNFSYAAQIFNANIRHDWESSRYTINVNNTIIDNKTGITWKKCIEGLSGSDCSIGSPTSYNWQQALDLANNASFAGFSDWCLPNVKEFRTIIAFDRAIPSINNSIFPNTITAFYWSSTPSASSSYSAWSLSFYGGTDSPVNRLENQYVRLVRCVQ